MLFLILRLKPYISPSLPAVASSSKSITSYFQDKERLESLTEATFFIRNTFMSNEFWNFLTISITIYVLVFSSLVLDDDQNDGTKGKQGSEGFLTQPIGIAIVVFLLILLLIFVVFLARRFSAPVPVPSNTLPETGKENPGFQKMWDKMTILTIFIIIVWYPSYDLPIPNWSIK